MHIVYGALGAMAFLACGSLIACSSEDPSSVGKSTSALGNDACGLDPVAAAGSDRYFDMASLASLPLDCRLATSATGPSAGRLQLAFWQMGAAAASAPVSWSVGDVTGLAIDPAARASTQRGPNDLQFSTAGQLTGDAFGIWINSGSTNVPFNGNILPVVAHYDFPDGAAPKPFADPGKELSFALDAQVPTSSSWGAGVAYAATVFRFKDTNPTHEGRAVWFSMAMFDPRGAEDDSIILDGCSTCSGDPIVLTSFSPLRHYGVLGAGSSTFSSTPFSGFRHFDYHVSAASLAAALRATQSHFKLTETQLSTNPAEYALVHFNVNPEVYAPDNGASGGGSIGLSARNLVIERTPEPPPAPFDRVVVRAANGSRVPELQVFFKTAVSNFYDEKKSVRVAFPTGGREVVIAADFHDHPDWKGTITGIRVDPFDSRDHDACFNIDEISIEDDHGRRAAEWFFDSPPDTTPPPAALGAPFFGWTLFGMERFWNDGRYWGACSDPTWGDPSFSIDLALSAGR